MGGVSGITVMVIEMKLDSKQARAEMNTENQGWIVGEGDATTDGRTTQNSSSNFESH